MRIFAGEFRQHVGQQGKTAEDRQADPQLSPVHLNDILHFRVQLFFQKQYFLCPFNILFPGIRRNQPVAGAGEQRLAHARFQALQKPRQRRLGQV